MYPGNNMAIGYFYSEPGYAQKSRECQVEVFKLSGSLTLIRQIVRLTGAVMESVSFR